MSANDPLPPLLLQHRLHQSRDLPDRWAKQVLERPTKLDGCIRELWASPTFAADSGKPGHALIQPDRQPTTSSQRGVALLPVGGAVTNLTGVVHAASLPLATHWFVLERRANLPSIQIFST